MAGRAAVHMFCGLLVLLVGSSVAIAAPELNSTDCSCGYYDGSSKNLFTESIIVYFNETTALPLDDLIPQSYENKYEKGWNTQYRQAATVANVRIANTSTANSSTPALELYVDPTTPDHVVVGGGVRTTRQDIRYGSFRTLLQPPGKWASGSALSMLFDYNDTQSIEMSTMNTNDPSTAWVSMLNHNEFPDRPLGVDYRALSNASNGLSPWDFTEFRIDWTEEQLNFYVGGKLFRTVSKKHDTHFPTTPMPLSLKHWSVGNFFSMQGPPSQRLVASVGWIRLFFNSSATTSGNAKDFQSRCRLSDACSVDDLTLRGSTTYSSESTIKYRESRPPRANKTIPIIMLIAFGTISGLLLFDSMSRRIPWHRMKKSNNDRVEDEKQFASQYEPSARLFGDGPALVPAPFGILEASTVTSMTATPLDQSRRASFSGEVHIRMSDRVERTGACLKPIPGSVECTPGLIDGSLEPSSLIQDAASTETAQAGPHQSTVVMHKGPTLTHHGEDIEAAHPYSTLGGSAVQKESVDGLGRDELGLGGDGGLSPKVQQSRPIRSGETWGDWSQATTDENRASLPLSQVFRFSSTPVRRRPLGPDAIVQSPSPSAQAGGGLPTSKQRVDYLAGLVALSSLLVTAIHFCLTFTSAAINPGAFEHYSSEIWARKTINPYFLNLIWIGPFLMTSTRFLVASYLKSGNLRGVAEKTVGRPFRLLIPILAIAMLEYFFMDGGATAWLEYLPSVTWSTWPFTTVPNTFGNFLSEILELGYLIPNAAPQLTFNYCTGVLWTIPVQLQGSWVTLLAVIVIREIKTPWKRFGYYVFCTIINWYALSWGSYFYLGIMLTDLDLTYGYRKWLHARPLFYYPLLTVCAIIGFGGLTMDLVSQWTLQNYATSEYGLHPDIATGLPIMRTGAAGYPQYYVPKLNGLIFSVGFQAVVELSPIVQKALSVKVLTFVFPHIFTIYLVHGFIFWSLGAMVCVYLSAHGLPYWLNLLIVAIACYSALVVSLPILTPIVETLGKNVTTNIWQYAYEEPAPRRPTLYPYPEDLLFARQKFGHEGEQMVTKDRGRFMKLVTALAASFSPKFSNQPCQPTVDVEEVARHHSQRSSSVPKDVASQIRMSVEALRSSSYYSLDNSQASRAHSGRAARRPNSGLSLFMVYHNNVVEEDEHASKNSSRSSLARELPR